MPSQPLGEYRCQCAFKQSKSNITRDNLERDEIRLIPAVIAKLNRDCPYLCPKLNWDCLYLCAADFKWLEEFPKMENGKLDWNVLAETR